MYQQLEQNQIEDLLRPLGLKIICLDKSEIPSYLDENNQDKYPTFEIYGESLATEDLRELTAVVLRKLQEIKRGATAIYVRECTLQQSPQIGYFLQLKAAMVRRAVDLTSNGPNFDALTLSGEQVTFGVALEALKAGYRVRRESWHPGTFVYLVPGSQFVVNRAPLLGIYPEGTEIKYAPHIDIRSGDNECAVWQISQDAVLAEDWTLCMRGA